MVEIERIRGGGKKFSNTVRLSDCNRIELKSTCKRIGYSKWKCCWSILIKDCL